MIVARIEDGRGRNMYSHTASRMKVKELARDFLNSALSHLRRQPAVFSKETPKIFLTAHK